MKIGDMKMIQNKILMTQQINIELVEKEAEGIYSI
jgi:hypothetical protein